MRDSRIHGGAERFVGHTAAATLDTLGVSQRWAPSVTRRIRLGSEMGQPVVQRRDLDAREPGEQLDWDFLITTLGGRYLVFSLEQIGATIGVSGGDIPQWREQMGANPPSLTLWGWHQTRSGWRRRLKARRQGLSIRTLRGNVSILNLTHVQLGTIVAPVPWRSLCLSQMLPTP